MTPARELVVLVAQLKTVAVAVKGGLARRRWSKLGEWLMMARAESHAFLDFVVEIVRRMDPEPGFKLLPPR